MVFVNFSLTEKLKKKCLTSLQLLDMKVESDKIKSTLISIEEEDKLSEDEKKGSDKERSASSDQSKPVHVLWTFFRDSLLFLQETRRKVILKDTY